jgi:hypothetical protein
VRTGIGVEHHERGAITHGPDQIHQASEGLATVNGHGALVAHGQFHLGQKNLFLLKVVARFKSIVQPYLADPDRVVRHQLLKPLEPIGAPLPHVPGVQPQRHADVAMLAPQAQHIPPIPLVSPVAAHHAYPGRPRPDQGGLQAVTQKAVLEVAMRVNKVRKASFGQKIHRHHAVISPPRVDAAVGRAHEKSSAHKLKEDSMENLLYLLLLVGIWVVLVKVVFPKMGIQG